MLLYLSALLFLELIWLDGKLYFLFENFVSTCIIACIDLIDFVHLLFVVLFQNCYFFWFLFLNF